MSLDRSTIKLTRVALKDLVPLQRGLRQATVDAKRKMIREGEPVDAPLVFRASGVLYVGDGHHTCEACYLEGYSHVQVRIIELGKVDVEAQKLLKAKLGTPSTDDIHADPFRMENRKAEKTMKRELAPVLKRAGKSVADQIATVLDEAGLAKAEDPTKPPPVTSPLWDEWMANFIQEQLDLGDLLELQTPIYEGVSKIAKSSGRKVLAELMPDQYKDLVNVVNERAEQWARRRAGELIGKNPRGTGELAETTRKRIRNVIADGLQENIGRDGIIARLEEDFAFSPERAELIANTEISNANSEGSMQGYRQAEETGLTVLKGWLCEPDACDVCLENEAAGFIPLDETFPSGHERPVAHPNCRCTDVAKVVEPAVKMALAKSFHREPAQCNAAHHHEPGDGKQKGYLYV